MRSKRLISSLAGLLVLSVICGNAFAESPVGFYDVILDEVRTECEKVYRGALGLRVELEAHVVNSGCPSATADITSVSPKFYTSVGVDVTSNYTIIADSGNDTTIDIPGGTPVVLVFWVRPLATATLGTITVDGEIFTGGTSCVTSPDLTAVLKDSWEVFKPIKLEGTEGIPAPSPPDKASMGFSLAPGFLGTTGDIDIWTGAPDSILLAGWVGGNAPHSVSYGCQDVVYGAFEEDIIPFPIQTFAEFGYSIAVADISDDGIDDLVVSTPRLDISGVIDAGRVSVFWGPDYSNFDATHFDETTFGQSLQAGAMFGHTVATGDFDDDGIPDIAVGVPHGGGATRPGEVYLIKSVGGRSFVFTTPAFSSPSPVSNGRFGWAVEAGRVLGATQDELLVGAPDEGAGEGRAWLNRLPFSTTIAWIEYIPFPGSGALDFGSAVAFGFVGLPGPATIAIGDIRTSPSNRWLVSLYSISGTIWGAVQDPTPASPNNENVGQWMSLVLADIDGVGFHDVMVGVGTSPCGSANSGEIFAFLDFSAGGLPGETRYMFWDFNMSPPPAQARYGYALFAADLTPCAGLEVVAGIPGAWAGEGSIEVYMKEP